MTNTAIVTGSGSGIGQAIALRLAADGYNVVVNDFRAEAAQATAAMIGAKAVAIGGDVSVEGDVAAIVAAAAAFGPVTHLVNCAGHVHQSRFTDLTVGDFDRMIAVHLRGTFLCTHAVLAGMIARGSGVIVNIASQLGQIGGIELAHYAAAKAGIIGMTKSLAREVRNLSADWQRAKAAELPLGRFGEPEEVASTVAFLCSDQASLFVGQTLGPNSGDVML
jgi:3-oxoacyl-[acyl-carrier protein] reductase